MAVVASMVPYAWLRQWDGPLFFWRGGGWKFFQDKQFFSVLLSVQTIFFFGCIFLQTIFCVFFCIIIIIIIIIITIIIITIIIITFIYIRLKFIR